MCGLIMLPLRRHLSSPQGFAWLLALALLLPLAQVVAAWHALAHLDAAKAAADSGARHTTVDLTCDLCEAAAAIGSGALPRVPLLLVEPPSGHHRTAGDRIFRVAVRPSHYLSRAPPAAFR
jgi:hypothetical protein